MGIRITKYTYTSSAQVYVKHIPPRPVGEGLR